jgi:hypothetical protein
MYKINQEILKWSTEGKAICTGTNLDTTTFNVDSVNEDGYVVLWCNPLRNRFYVLPQYLVSSMKQLVEQFPPMWLRCTSIYVSFRTPELYHMFCTPDKRYGVDFGTHNEELYNAICVKYHDLEVSGGFFPDDKLYNVQWEMSSQEQAINIVDELFECLDNDNKEYVNWYELNEDGLEVIVD